jgi:Flp pilus assembly protein TadD
MRSGIARVLCVAAAGLWLAGCNTTGGVPDLFSANTAPPAEGNGTQAMAAVPPAAETLAQGGLLGNDPNDDLSLGKKHYRAGNYGLAEQHFRKAVETHPRDAEAWLGLAASYDRLRRFDLADRAYAQAISIVGPTAEILNNQGFSYMLRGDYAQARAKLVAAQRRDPGNRFVANNLHLLNESIRQGKAVQ